jgi:GNAT superfamily N-acetyltransferase
MRASRSSTTRSRLPTSSVLRSFAEDPAAWGELPPESPWTRVLTDRYCVLFGPVPSSTQVSRLRLDPDEIAETIAEVRVLVADHDHRSALWHVGSSATPADLVDRLVAHGLQADDHHASLLSTVEPPPGPPAVEARRVQDLDEFRLAAEIAHDVFETPDERRREWEAAADALFADERSDRVPRVYLAHLEGRVAGTASSVVEDGLPAAIMTGGGVRPEFRRRGVYRALVRARWDDAVAAGIPALCVQAGALSRPILERLGFEKVAEQEVLLDPTTC